MLTHLLCNLRATRNRLVWCIITSIFDGSPEKLFTGILSVPGAESDLPKTLGDSVSLGQPVDSYWVIEWRISLSLSCYSFLPQILASDPQVKEVDSFFHTSLNLLSPCWNKNCSHSSSPRLGLGWALMWQGCHLVFDGPHYVSKPEKRTRLRLRYAGRAIRCYC